MDPKIQIKYVDPKNQLIDIPTKGSFTRDEWNHLLHLFNVMSNFVSSCSHLSNQIDDPRATSKRQMQEKNNEEEKTSELLQKRDLREIWSPRLPIGLQQCQLELCIKFSSVTHRFCPELEHVDTCCEIEKEHHQSNFDPSQFDHIATHCRIFAQSLRKRATETWSSKRRQN